MEWNNDGFKTTPSGMGLSSKILLGIIACVILIILLIFVLLMNMGETTTTFAIYVDGKTTTTAKESLLTSIDNKTYVSIEQFAKIVGYEYHTGEYKAYIVEEGKCYVEGINETASFYLDDNKVYKLPVNEREKEYEEYTIENTIKSVSGKIYAPVDAISKAFNVVIDEKDTYFQIYTLDYLVNTYDAKVKEWGYASIADQSFENDKALLYGYLIVKKEGGLYKIIDTENTKGIVLDRYSSINFSEYMQEFYVTNDNKNVGVINLDGTTKIEPNYESISVLNKEADLYLIKQYSKYGVVKGGNISIIYPEYDSIGIEDGNIGSDKYLLLDSLIPVCKGEKWGAYDKQGNKVLEIEYDGLGYNSTSIEINGAKKSVQPVIEIERANGIVVKQAEKYGLVSLEGKILVSVVVDAIYAINGAQDDDSKYFMLYNGNELNVIERLIEADKIGANTNKDTITDSENNNSVNISN